MKFRPQRLSGFNYRTPYFYMVTITALRGLPKLFSKIDDVAYSKNNITEAFLRTIRHFHEGIDDIDPIKHFTIMPDHLHVLIRLREREVDGKKFSCSMSLVKIAEILKDSLAAVYAKEVGWTMDRPMSFSARVFEPTFHDKIIYRAGQLRAFTRYIHDNPRRAILRRKAMKNGWFNRIYRVSFMDRTWFAYGNTELLKLPDIQPIIGLQTAKSDEWKPLVNMAARLGPGSAGISTFSNEHERECARAIGHAGGNWIILSTHGFPPENNGFGYDLPEGELTRWHPSDKQEPACAKGKILYLCPWPGTRSTLSLTDYHQRIAELRHILSTLHNDYTT